MLRHRTTLIIIIAYIGVFVVLSLVGAWFAKRNLDREMAISAPHNFVTDMTYVDLSPIEVAITSSPGKAAKVRLDISLEIAAKNESAISGAAPRITERISQFLGTVNTDQIHDSSELLLLRKEMLRQINLVTAPIPVHDLMIQQFFVM